MAVTAVTVDPDDVTDVSFDAAAWCTAARVHPAGAL